MSPQSNTGVDPGKSLLERMRKEGECRKAFFAAALKEAAASRTNVQRRLLSPGSELRELIQADDPVEIATINALKQIGADLNSVLWSLLSVQPGLGPSENIKSLVRAEATPTEVLVARMKADSDYIPIKIVTALVEAGANPAEVLSARLRDEENEVDVNVVAMFVQAGTNMHDVLSGLVTHPGIDPYMSVRLLKQAGVNIAHTSAHSTLYYAAQNSQSHVLTYLLEEHPELIDTPCYEGRTALMAACKCSDLYAVTHLLDAGADRDLQDDCGFTALHHAAHINRDVVDELIHRKVNLYQQNFEGNTALHHAIIGGSLAVVEALLEGAVRGDKLCAETIV